MRAFISYSHRDQAELGRLHTHLAPLRSEGLIDTWYDRQILAGGKIDAEIDRELESCDLFLLLVSPDFLASDYCVNREMSRALEHHRDDAAPVVPIIVEPCDWLSSPLRELKALPRDGKPISEWPNPNNAYLDVVRELRRILEARKVAGPPMGRATFSEETNETRPVAAPRSRYRVQRDFDDIDLSEFRETAFATIRDYFQHQIAEINTISDLRGRFVSHGPSSFGCTIVNRARVSNSGTAHITVHCKKNRIGFGDIYYSFLENADPNSANGIFYVESDEYEMYLSSMMTFGSDRGRLTPEEAAEHLWADFIQKAGVFLQP